MGKVKIKTNELTHNGKCHRIEMQFEDGSEMGINLPPGLSLEEIEGHIRAAHNDYMARKNAIAQYKSTHAGRKPHEDVKQEYDF